MAPIKSIFTSALMLSAAIAAPVDLKKKEDVKADVPSGTKIKHHSEPMHKASPVMSRLPSGTFDTQAMQSSALAAAANLPASEDNGILNALEDLPLRTAGEKGRRQLDALTSFLTKLNQAVKRDDLDARQLGAVKSAPEALGQLGNVFEAVTSLPIKRGDDGSGSLGGLGGLLNGLAKREGIESEDAMLEELAKRGGSSGLGDLAGLGGLLNGLAKREDTESDADYAKTRKTMLKSLSGMLHEPHKDSDESKGKGKVEEPFGLGQLAKRGGSSGLGDLGGLGGLLNGLAKREDAELDEDSSKSENSMLKGFHGMLHDSKNDKEEPEGKKKVVEPYGLGQLAKRGGSSGLGDLGGLGGLLNGLAKREEMASSDTVLEELAKRGGSSGLGDLGGLGGLLNGLAKREDMASSDTVLEELAKRGGGLGDLTDVGNLLGVVDAIGLLARDGMYSTDNTLEELAKRENTDSSNGMLDDELAKRQLSGLGGIAGSAESTAEGLLESFAKRENMGSETDTLDELARRQLGNLGGPEIENLLGGLAKRQFGAVSSLATGALSNAGTAASHLGKLVTGKHRRDNGHSAGGVDPVTAATVPLTTTQKHDTSNDDDMSGPEEVAKEVAEGEKTAEQATKTFADPSNKGPSKGPLAKRQVPPIAGADLPTVVKGLAANPSLALAPVTEGIRLGGTGLGDMFHG